MRLTEKLKKTFMKNRDPHSFESYYKKIRNPKKKGAVSITKDVESNLIQTLEGLNLKVDTFKINPEEYKQYIHDAQYREKYPEYYHNNFAEKSLEHFIALKLLDLGPADIFIDIASQHSPVPEIYQRLFGLKAFKQDLDYPAGILGNRIGGDAAQMPVPDGFATKMTLHCSLEHFEKDSDHLFIKEAGRVLASSGKICIVPLYLSEQYAIMTDPMISVPADVDFDPEATVYCAEGWNNRHGRFYSPQKLIKRILESSEYLSYQLFHITNPHEIDQSCYVRFALILEKL